jgi:hypothetical protein
MVVKVTDKHTGQCLCGSVRYEIAGPLRPVITCHCSQCRRSSGHFVATTNAPSAKLKLIAQDSLAWFRSSEKAERGFCSRCGGNLFWRRIGSDTTSIMAGTLDPPTGLAIEKHIFVGGKSDYYALDDGLPQFHEW